MDKALYGHPEAGAHWEVHLTKIVKKLGGVVVKSHPSCFWFPEWKLLLTIYVDDLLLAGPAHLHKQFWETLVKDVSIEDPEDLDLFLGRRHKITEFKRLKYDLVEYFKSPFEF